MQDQRMSREDYKAQQALEEARKAGTAPPEVDEDGNAINPHIPQYISQAPWYLENARKPGLKHQRLQASGGHVSMDVWYKKGLEAKGDRVKRWRPGCCQNCGASTHKTKECLEKPHKIGAQFDERKLGREDVVTDLDLDFDAKRDRWNGFDPSKQLALIERYNLYEAERKRVKQQELAKEATTDKPAAEESNHSDSESDGDQKKEDIHEEYRQDESTAQMMSQRETATISVRTTVRDLRIREDTAKYLINLDVNSAYFDPKTRSMRDDPLKGINESEERLYRGDNYVRMTGQVNDFNNLQLFAWQAQEKGQHVHAQGVPSQAEAMHRQFHARKEQLKDEQRSSLIGKYGGEEHLQSLPKPLLMGQSENYVEYSPSGKVIKGQEKAVPKSKYEEDVHPNNHTSVWGSYWEAGKWGYACCKHVFRNAYCTAKSDQAALEAERRGHTVIDASKTVVAGIDFEKPASKSKSKAKSSEDESAERLQAALEKEEQRKRHPEELDDRKRKYNSMRANETEVTDEDMEAWRLKRTHWEDPMSQM